MMAQPYANQIWGVTKKMNGTTQIKSEQSPKRHNVMPLRYEKAVQKKFMVLRKLIVKNSTRKYTELRKSAMKRKSSHRKDGTVLYQ